MSTVAWSAVGPAPQQNGNVAFTGRVNAFAVSRNFDGLGTAAMFAGTDGGGIWRASQFTGAAPHWQPLTDFVAAPTASRSGLSNVTTVAVDPHNASVIYAGSGVGILRSLDGGTTWMLLPNSPMGASKIIVDARAGGTAVLAGGPFGLQISGNGLQWISVPLGGWGFTSFSVDDLEWMLSADLKTLTVFAAVHDTTPNSDGNRNGIYVTRNEGGTWDKTASDPVNREDGNLVFPPNWGAITLGADHVPGSTVMPVAVISKKDADWRHAILLNVFRLETGTWTPIGADLPKGLDTQGGANQPIVTTSTGAIYFGVSGNFSPAVFQSVDGGAHWSDISGANGVSPHVDHHAMLFTDGSLYDGNDGGIWRFNPRGQNQPGGGSWEHLNTPGLQTIEVQGVSLNPLDLGVILVGSQDNGTALRTAGTWHSVQGGDRGRVRYDIAGKYAYSVTYGWFDRSNDSGASWGALGLPGSGEFADGIMQTYEVDPFRTGRLLIAGVHGTWMSTDNGDHWSKIAPALTGEPNGITAMAFSPSASTFYLAFNNGQLFRTTNSGGDGRASNWTDVSVGTAWGGMIASLAVDPASADALYLATTGGASVWRTQDAGAHWDNLTSDLPAIGITSPLQLATKPNGPYMFVGTPSGVYGCANPASPRWRRIGSGFPYVRVSELEYRASHDTLAAGTYGRGVFVAHIGSLAPPTLQVEVPTDDCGIGPVEGQTIALRCRIQPVDPGAHYTYTWTVVGAQPAPGEHGASATFKMIVPAQLQQVQASVTVNDDDGFVGTANKTFAAIGIDVANRLYLICQLKRYLKHNFLIDPLWDPLRDFVTHPVTDGDLRRVIGLAEHFENLARTALTATEQARTRVQVGPLPTSIDMRDRADDAERERRG